MIEWVGTALPAIIIFDNNFRYLELRDVGHACRLVPVDMPSELSMPKSVFGQLVHHVEFGQYIQSVKESDDHATADLLLDPLQTSSSSQEFVESIV